MSDVWRGQKRPGCSSSTERASIPSYLPCLQARREVEANRATLGTALNGRPYSVVAGNSQLEQILDQGFVLPSNHEPGQDYVEPETNLRDILSSSDPLRSTVEVCILSCVSCLWSAVSEVCRPSQRAIEILSEDSSSSPSSVIPSRVPPQGSPSSTRSRHLASFGRSALQLLNALDEGPQGRGLAHPKRKVALVMKTPGPPGSSSMSGFGNRWFTDAVELDEEEEFDATGASWSFPLSSLASSD